MKEIRVAEGVIPLGEFKTHAARYLRQLDGPIIITQNGRPAGVLLSPAEYDRVREQHRLLESVASGLADAQAGKVIETDELQKKLAAARVLRKTT